MLSDAGSGETKILKNDDGSSDEDVAFSDCRLAYHVFLERA